MSFHTHTRVSTGPREVRRAEASVGGGGDSSMRPTHRMTCKIDVLGSPASKTVTAGKGRSWARHWCYTEIGGIGIRHAFQYTDIKWACILWKSEYQLL